MGNEAKGKRKQQWFHSRNIQAAIIAGVFTLLGAILGAMVGPLLLGEKPILESVLTGNAALLRSDAPIPRCSVTADKPVSLSGQWITLTVTAENQGATADWQTVQISFPESLNPDNIRIVSYSLDTTRVYHPGETVNGLYIAGHIALSYPIVEGNHSPWYSGEIRQLSIRVKPEKEGTFLFYVKCVAGFSGGVRYDPSLGVKDQQDEYVYPFEIIVGRGS